MTNMHIKIKVNSIYFLVFTVIIALIGYCMEQPMVCLLIAMFQLIVIVHAAKISIFSILAVLINFCLVQQYAAFIGVEVYGLLGITSVPIYFYELFLCVYFFNAVLHLFITHSNCLRNESELFKEKLDIGYGFSIVLAVLAVVITVLIFPTMPSLLTFSTVQRFDGGILSFSGWSCIPFFFLAIAIINRKGYKYVVPMAVFVSIWYVFHGERVDCIGFLALFAIGYYNEHREKSTIIKICISGLVIIITLVGVGFLRGGTDSINYGDLLHGVFIQSTACDVTYVFNCAVDLTKNSLSYHGITYLSYLINCIPLLEDPYSFQSYIHNDYVTAGGGLFFAEPIANFGVGFACVFSAFYILFLVSVIRKRTRYRYMVYAAICITIFRSAWYGLNYPIITILYFAPALLVAYNLLTRKKES